MKLQYINITIAVSNKVIPVSTHPQPKCPRNSVVAEFAMASVHCILMDHGWNSWMHEDRQKAPW
jgi:hypothetical protein